MKGFLILFMFVQTTRVNCEFDYVTCELQPNITYTDSIIPSAQMKHFSLMGFYTVFAFVDSVYDFQQIRLLKTLQKRFQRSNFNNIQFVLINSYDSLNDDEGFEYMQYLVGSSMHIFQETSPDDIVLYRKSVSNSIIITDRCGRISYHIIPPWSFAQFPYIKAAILSTIYDNPCGICNMTSKPMNDVKFQKKFIKLNVDESKSTTNNENYGFMESKIDLLNFTDNKTKDIFTTINENNNENLSTEIDLPLKIILHLPHSHINSKNMNKFEYLVLKFGFPEFHGHLHPPIESLDTDLSNSSMNTIKCEGINSSQNELIVFENDENQSCNPNLEFIEVSSLKNNDKDEEISIENITSKDSSQLKIMNISNDDPLHNNTLINDEIDYNNKTSSDLFNHYSKLLFWLNTTI